MKEYLAALLGIAGLIVLCCEAESVAGQAVIALIGFSLWGAAWITYRLWPVEENHDC